MITNLTKVETSLSEEEKEILTKAIKCLESIESELHRLRMDGVICKYCDDFELTYDWQKIKLAKGTLLALKDTMAFTKIDYSKITD